MSGFSWGILFNFYFSAFITLIAFGGFSYSIVEFLNKSLLLRRNAQHLKQQ